MSSSSSSFFTPTNHLISTLSTRRHRRRKHLPPLFNFHLSSSDHSLSSTSNSTLLKTLSLSLSSAVIGAAHFSTGGSTGANTVGDGGGGGGGRGWFGGCFGGSSSDGSFWSRLLAPLFSISDESSQSREFDSHGLRANSPFHIKNLSRSKKYKISEISFFDQRKRAKIATDDDFLCEYVSLRAGGVYTKAQLQRQLEYLAKCGIFNKVDMKGKTNPDGTIDITILFTEATSRLPEKFRCISVGLMPKSEPIEKDPDMTRKEQWDYNRRRQRECKTRIEGSRPCMLPMSVHREIEDMLREQGSVSFRLLRRIRARVKKWYHDEGYVGVKSVEFRNLDKKELVCEVYEGDIIQVSIQFLDNLGYVVEGNTQIPVVQRVLPTQVQICL